LSSRRCADARGSRASWAKFIALGALVATLVVACRHSRPSHIYRLDSETRGWVVIVFNRAEAAPLPRQGDALLIDVPKSGVLVTSTPSPVGAAKDAVLVHHPDGHEEQRAWDTIQAQHAGALTRGAGKPMEYESFFLGSPAELAAAETEDQALARVHATLPQR